MTASSFSRRTVGFGLILLLILAFGGQRSAHAQVPGALKVEVRNANTARPVAQATVRARGRGGFEREVIADATGEATLSGLPPGLYELFVSQPEYQSLRLPSVRVAGGRTVVERLSLQPNERNIEEVLVTGEAVTGSNLNSVGTRFIDREALRSAAGSGSDALRALDGLPGLFSDGEFSSFTVRGNGPRDNLILVDGIPFDNVVHFQDSFGEQEEVDSGGRYSVFAPNVIAGAEFFPGGWDAAYGGKAGSLLKLQVAEGNPETAAYTARIDIAGVEVGYDGPSQVLDNTALLVSARTYNFERLFETVGIEDLGTPKLTDVVLKSTTEFARGDQLDLLVIYAPESFRRDVANALASDEDEPGVFEDVELVDIERDNSLVAATWATFIGRNGRLENRLYHRHFDESSELGEAYPDLVPPGTPAADVPAREAILVSSRGEDETGWRLDYANENAIGAFTTGLRVAQWDMDFNLGVTEPWIRYEFDQDDFRESPDQFYIVLTPESVANTYQQKETNYALFYDQELVWGPIDMRLGLRFERDNFARQDLFGPRMAVTWLASSAARATFTAGRYFQAPDFANRASDQNNSGLENEVVDQVSLGFEYTTSSDLQLFIEPYYQKLDDLVVQSDGVNALYANTGNGESFGVDTAITREFRDGWSADIKYSYNQATIKETQADARVDADFNRPHIFSIGGVWELNERWKVSSRWKWASGRPRDAYIIHEDVLGDAGPLRYSLEYTDDNVDRFGSFSALNLRVDYQRTFYGVSLIAFIDVINLLGSENPNDVDFNERSGRLEAEEGEALPLFGVRFEW